MHETLRMVARSIFLPAVLAAALSACTTVPQNSSAGDFDVRFAQTVADTHALSKNARVDEAIVLMEKATQSYPTRPEPFTQLARLRFDAGQYGLAIVAADEALKRNPDNTTALSVRAVAGLRIATESLEELRGNASVFGSTRPDAARLASTLRDVLGEEVLVPPALEPVKPARRRVNADGVRNGARSQLLQGESRPVPPVRRSTPTSAVDGDPFSVLRR